MNTKVSIYTLIFHNHILNPLSSAEVIASEVIHPDDIHVTFSGSSPMLLPWSGALTLRRYWRSRLHHLIVTRICHISPALPKSLQQFLPASWSAERCTAFWTSGMWKDHVGKSISQRIRGNVHKRCCVSLDKQMVWRV